MLSNVERSAGAWSADGPCFPRFELAQSTGERSRCASVSRGEGEGPARRELPNTHPSVRMGDRTGGARLFPGSIMVLDSPWIRRLIALLTIVAIGAPAGGLPGAVCCGRSCCAVSLADATGGTVERAASASSAGCPACLQRRAAARSGGSRWDAPTPPGRECRCRVERIPQVPPSTPPLRDVVFPEGFSSREASHSPALHLAADRWPVAEVRSGATCSLQRLYCRWQT